MTAVRIPHDALEEDTLRHLLEEFVTREGTDYGDRIFSLAEKVRHVRRQLDTGQACIVFDPHSNSCHIVGRDDLPEQDDDIQGDGDDADGGP